MTDTQKLKLIDAIIADGIEFAPESENNSGYYMGILMAIGSVIAMKDEGGE